MSTLEHLVQRKAALRAEQRRRRQAVAAQSGSAGEAVAERLIESFPLPSAAVVSGYWPLEDELDPRPCMTRLAAQGHPLALPRVQGRGRPLAFHAWHPGDLLLAGPFGVMEPDPDAPAVRPRVLLVPLLAFDRQGRRLGYGAGYYDLALRELRALGPLPLAIGVAFAAQEVDEVPTGPRDQPLDAVVTERAVHRCSGPAGAGSAAAALETGRA